MQEALQDGDLRPGVGQRNGGAGVVGAEEGELLGGPLLGLLPPLGLARDPLGEPGGLPQMALGRGGPLGGHFRGDGDLLLHQPVVGHRHIPRQHGQQVRAQPQRLLLARRRGGGGRRLRQRIERLGFGGGPLVRLQRLDAAGAQGGVPAGVRGVCSGHRTGGGLHGGACVRGLRVAQPTVGVGQSSPHLVQAHAGQGQRRRQVGRFRRPVGPGGRGGPPDARVQGVDAGVGPDGGEGGVPPALGGLPGVQLPLSQLVLVLGGAEGGGREHLRPGHGGAADEQRPAERAEADQGGHHQVVQLVHGGVQRMAAGVLHGVADVLADAGADVVRQAGALDRVVRHPGVLDGVLHRVLNGVLEGIGGRRLGEGHIRHHIADAGDRLS
ncbi:hypothetical protein SVIO_015180 [Streptomyces violaceusniger]|uniref:Uncharacterized protein n=1 Tax=Streptomyces violaceusniger TaxID=68280 RepID=A0A4D4KPR7_STRVO|nr:hypothetical protein SVIO_015180 [Streptomyces violaceusniger]